MGYGMKLSDFLLSWDELYVTSNLNSITTKLIIDVFVLWVSPSFLTLNKPMYFNLF
jgi:hypothetical protein